MLTASLKHISDIAHRHCRVVYAFSELWDPLKKTVWGTENSFRVKIRAVQQRAKNLLLKKMLLDGGGLSVGTRVDFCVRLVDRAFFFLHLMIFNFATQNLNTHSAFSPSFSLLLLVFLLQLLYLVLASPSSTDQDSYLFVLFFLSLSYFFFQPFLKSNRLLGKSDSFLLYQPPAIGKIVNKLKKKTI